MVEMLKWESLTFRRCIEVAVACVVIAVVWGLLLLPTLFYHLPQVSNKRFHWEWSPYSITGAHSIDRLFLFSYRIQPVKATELMSQVIPTWHPAQPRYTWATLAGRSCLAAVLTWMEMVKSISPQMEIKKKLKDTLHNFHLVFGFLTQVQNVCKLQSHSFVCICLGCAEAEKNSCYHLINVKQSGAQHVQWNGKGQWPF